MTDIGLPDMTGLELARLVSIRFPDVPVVLVSAFVPDTVDSRWHALHKPVRPAKIVATVSNVCRRAENEKRGSPSWSTSATRSHLWEA